MNSNSSRNHHRRLGGLWYAGSQEQKAGSQRTMECKKTESDVTECFMGAWLCFSRLCLFLQLWYCIREAVFLYYILYILFLSICDLKYFECHSALISHGLSIILSHILYIQYIYHMDLVNFDLHVYKLYIGNLLNYETLITSAVFLSIEDLFICKERRLWGGSMQGVIFKFE